MTSERNIVMGIWNLNATGGNTVENPSTFPSRLESVIYGDKRVPVDREHIKPNGKYRSLVKLFMKFVKDKKVIWLMGTAWLIRSDLLVTAGHNVYDWEYNLGCAREIKASLGYWGEDSVDNTVQFRYGTKVATSSGWLATKDNRINDVAFIKLNRAFDGTDTEMNLFHFKATPVSGEQRMGIVGYPGDLDRGNRPYEEFKDVKYDLSQASRNMLVYQISTAKGQSGSPVLLDDYNTSIGTHVNGDFFENSASPIAGEYGNLYHAYIRAIDGHYTTVKRKDEVEYVRVTIPNDPERPYEAAEESLITVGGNVSSNILKLGSPFLGPIGGPIAALAATCVLFAGGVCESALETEGSVSGSDITAYAHHAILAEAAIQATNRLNREALHKLNFEENVKEEYSTLASQVYGIGSKIFPVLMESALRLALEAYHVSESRQQSTPTPEPESLPKLAALQYTEEGSNQDSQTEAFINNLLQDFRPVHGEQKVLDQLGSVIVNGLRTSKTIQTMAPTGLCLLSSLLAPTQSRTQSTELDIYFEDLLDRALMAEATLRAIIFAKKTVRNQTVSVSEDEKKAVLQEEGFYDILKSEVQGIGRKVIESTPSVISKLQPLLMELLSPNKATKQLDIPIPGYPTQDLETNLAFARKSVRLPDGPVIQRSTRLGAVATRYGNNHNLDGPSVAFSSPP